MKIIKKILGAALAVAMIAPNTSYAAKQPEKIRIYTSMKDGVYEAQELTGSDSDAGFIPYEIKVYVTVSDHTITNISFFGVGGENVSYAQSAYDEIAPNLIGSREGKVEVDIVSGATQSSKAMTKAIQSALRSASFVGPDMHDIVVNKQGNQISFDTVENIESYVLYRNGEKIATLTEPAYLDTKAKKNGKKYSYSVSVIANGQESDPSNEVSTYYLKKNAINILINGSPGKMTFTWNRNKKADGYEIQYGTSKTFAGAKTLRIAKKNLVISTTSNMRVHQSYYVRVRSYKTLGQQKYYSEWSKAKKLRINR